MYSVWYLDIEQTLYAYVSFYYSNIIYVQEGTQLLIRMYFYWRHLSFCMGYKAPLYKNICIVSQIALKIFSYLWVLMMFIFQEKV